MSRGEGSQQNTRVIAIGDTFLDHEAGVTDMLQREIIAGFRGKQSW